MLIRCSARIARTANGLADQVLASVGDGNGIRNDASESPELKTLYNKWRAFHGASYACAMATLATSIYYALCIAERYL